MRRFILILLGSLGVLAGTAVGQHQFSTLPSTEKHFGSKSCHFVRAIQVANSTRFVKAIFERFDEPKGLNVPKIDQWRFAVDPKDPGSIDTIQKGLRKAIATSFLVATKLDRPWGAKFVRDAGNTFTVDVNLNELVGWTKPIIISTDGSENTTTQMRITIDYVADPFLLLDVQPIWPEVAN